MHTLHCEFEVLEATSLCWNKIRLVATRVTMRAHIVLPARNRFAGPQMAGGALKY